MSEYDQILKEKKIYHDPKVKRSKYTKYVYIYLVSLSLLLVISYLIYYHTILSPIHIIQNDLSNILTKYQEVYQNFLPPSLSSVSNLEGSIAFDDMTYNYGLIKEKNRYELELANQEGYIHYQMTPTNTKIDLSSLDHQQITHSNKIDLLGLKNRMNNLMKEKKYLKSFYFEGKKPIVEINFTLTEKEINQILAGNGLTDEYHVIVTLKNDAIKNEIQLIKVVINNKTKNQRSTLEYDNQNLFYTNPSNQKYKISFYQHQKDFSIKIYQGEELYSIFLGKEYDNSYSYTYQIINKIYNINLSISNQKDNYSYQITLKKGQDKNVWEDKMTIQLKLNSKPVQTDKNRDSKEISYRSLNKEKKELYQKKIEEFFLPLKEFFNQYKPDIDDLDS